MSPRRIRWTVRAVLYGGLLAVALGFWLSRPGEEVVLAGETSQSEYFNVQARDDGDVDSFQTHIITRCSGDFTRDVSWTPADGDPVGFGRDDEAIDVREEWSHDHDDGTREEGWATLEGRVAADGRSATGTMAAGMTFERDGREIARCGARDVSFSAAAVE